VREIDGETRRSVLELLEAASEHDGSPALSDHLTLDLVRGGGEGFAALLVEDPESDSGSLGAYGQISRTNEGATFEAVIRPALRAERFGTLERLLTAAVRVVASDGGGTLGWWVTEPTDDDQALADGAEMAVDRTLYQMRRPLPAEARSSVETRDFVIGGDEGEWVAVNNRAFAEHGEQGGWTLDTLAQRERESWFDPQGFRIHERDGRVAAFCWTKVHDAGSDHAVGEIYVIAVDPDYHGLGLGRQLTLAGLDHLTDRGLRQAMLYVDADNAAAVGLYGSLGFEVTSTRAAFVRRVPSSLP
jgi:mycothiol synthase